MTFTVSMEGLAALAVGWLVGGVIGNIIGNLISARLNKRAMERRERQSIREVQVEAGMPNATNKLCAQGVIRLLNKGRTKKLRMPNSDT